MKAIITQSRFVITLLLGIIGILSTEARDINVRGIVTDVSGQPLLGVCIYNAETDKLLSTTNEEGKYLVIVDSDDKLVFSISGMEETEVPVEGRLTIDVTLIRSAIILEGVTVKGKGKLKVVAPEKTDVELKGNYAYIKTRITVPGRLFDSSTRLIIQPALYNVTASHMWYLKPVVYDGFRYNITQDRMHDFNAGHDPLNPYVTVTHDRVNGNDIISWSDSVYLANPDHDFHCDMLMAMEDYNKVFYRDTTTIARGIVNPLRFFQYNLEGMELADSSKFPSPEMQMRDTKGDVMLTFRVGESKLDMSQGNNESEMNALIRQLREIEDNPDAALKSFTISCTSSPEGRYDLNVSLSNRRMQSALGVITNNLSPETRRYMELHSNAYVEPWTTLVGMLKADGHTSEADDVQKIIDAHTNSIDAQSNAIKRLPSYSSLIASEYLPRMRKVSYEFISSMYRYLTDDEIARIYETKPESLSRYEFFRYYRNVAKTPEEKERCMRLALKVHPGFVVAASDLSAMLTDQGNADPTLLRPFLKPGFKKVPEEAIYNQIAACLATHNFNEADSLASLLPDTEEFHKAIMYTNVMNGRFSEFMQEIAAESPVNEVVLLLALKANEQAWKKAQQLGETPEEEYIKAIAANRVDAYMAAMSHLENALRLKPELKEIAKVDGDLIELFEELEENNETEQ